MILELLLILPIYIGIFAVLYRFRNIIKMISDDEIFDVVDTPQEAVAQHSKREFLMEKLRSGEQISNSKTPWTEERLQKASDKVVEKLYDRYENPPPVKVDRQEALKLGKPVCPVVIELYAEGLKGILAHIPYVGDRYCVNVEKLKANISSNKLFCDNLAIKIGSKMIEQMGSNSPMQMGVSLATMTWECIETAPPSATRSEVGDSSGNNKDE